MKRCICGKPLEDGVQTPDLCRECICKDDHYRKRERDKIIKKWFAKHSEYLINTLRRRK